MEIIQKYKADDGTEFSDESKCQTYEQQCLQIDSIMKFMGPMPKDKGCVFANGGGYIPHNKQLVERARTKLMKLGIAVLDIKHEVGEYSIGRWFDDSGNRALYSAWGRLWHCDDQGREWGQGYYANNPEKGVQKEYREETKDKAVL